MPLKKGHSKKVVSQNIKELLHKFRSTGEIGTSTPPSDKAAQKQAIAIALSQAKRSKGKRKRKGSR